MNPFLSGSWHLSQQHESHWGNVLCFVLSRLWQEPSNRALGPASSRVYTHTNFEGTFIHVNNIPKLCLDHLCAQNRLLFSSWINLSFWIRSLHPCSVFHTFWPTWVAKHFPPHVLLNAVASTWNISLLVPPSGHSRLSPNTFWNQDFIGCFMTTMFTPLLIHSHFHLLNGCYFL